MTSILPLTDLKCLRKELINYSRYESTYWVHHRYIFQPSHRTAMILRKMIERYTGEKMQRIPLKTPVHWLIYKGLEIRLACPHGQITLEWHGEPTMDLPSA